MAASVASVRQLVQRFERLEARYLALEHLSEASDKVDAHIKEQEEAKKVSAAPTMDNAQILAQIAALTAIVQKNAGVAPAA